MFIDARLTRLRIPMLPYQLLEYASAPWDSQMIHVDSKPILFRIFGYRSSIDPNGRRDNSIIFSSKCSKINARQDGRATIQVRWRM